MRGEPTTDPRRRADASGGAGAAALRGSGGALSLGSSQNLARSVKSAVVKESEATERLIAEHGPVTALRLIGYLYKLDTEGEEWLREHVSRQQLNHVKARFEEAKVPFERGAIQWPGLAAVGVRLAAHRDRVKATNERQKAALAAQKAARGPRPA